MARGRPSNKKGGARSHAPSARHYPRTARLNALLTEIVADYFERADDEELGFMTITGVEVDSDLNVASIWISILGSDESGDEAVLEALAEHRVPVQRAIASQAKLRKTPEAVFGFDPAVRAGAKIDSILAGLGLGEDDEAEPDGTGPSEEADDSASSPDDPAFDAETDG